MAFDHFELVKVLKTARVASGDIVPTIWIGYVADTGARLSALALKDAFGEAGWVVTGNQPPAAVDDPPFTGAKFIAYTSEKGESKLPPHCRQRLTAVRAVLAKVGAVEEANESDPIRGMVGSIIVGSAL